MSKLLILALFALLVFAVVRWQGGQYRSFITCAAKAGGKITAKEERQVRPSTSGGRVEYILSYIYSVDGVEYNAQDNIEFKDLWLDFKEGQELEIYYSKKDPKTSHPVIVMDRRLGGTPATFGDGC